MKFIVTGSAGFTGTAVVQYLIQHSKFSAGVANTLQWFLNNPSWSGAVATSQTMTRNKG